MIELSPESKNRMTYNEAVIYCQFLEHNGHTDWRLPTFDEYDQDDNTYFWCWYEGCERYKADAELWVIPVRDI